MLDKAKKKKRYLAGFTLLETVISIGVVAIGGIAVLTLLNKTLIASALNKDLIVVVNLAREGAEIVRAVRDTEGFSALGPGSYVVDSNNNFNLKTRAQGITFSSPSIEDCTNCMLSLINSRYEHGSGGTATQFERLITIEDVTGFVTCTEPGPCHKRITSTVGWSKRNQSREFSVTVDLTDWR